jgi:hypothetical protein
MVSIVIIDKPWTTSFQTVSYKKPRSRLAGRESELERAHRKSISIITANIHVPSRGRRRTDRTPHCRGMTRNADIDFFTDPS